MAKIVECDMLKVGDGVLVQQLNCLCVRPHGLSATIAKRYPYGDVYGKRRSMGTRNMAIEVDRGVPGEIVVCEPNDDSDDPIIVGLYGQYDYGKPGKSYRTPVSRDSYEKREKWFEEALEKLGAWMIKNGQKRVYFPYQIGCGLAGGNWTRYLEMIEKFATDAPFETIICQLK